jgi:hypothetical protein
VSIQNSKFRIQNSKLLLTRALRGPTNLINKKCIERDECKACEKKPPAVY